MNKQIIFLVSDITATGGIERVISYIANDLDTKNFHVTILSLHKTSENLFYPLADNVRIEFISNKIKLNKKPGSLAKLLSHLALTAKLNFFLLKNKNNILVVNSFPMSVISFFSLLFIKKAFVVEHVHYNYYSSHLRKIRSFIYRFYNAVITLTDRDANQFKLYNSKVICIPNPLCFDFKKKKQIEICAKKIIAVGRLEHQKGFDLLINAFKGIDEKIRSGWVLDIYGEGTLREQLQHQINTNGLSQSIKLKGNVGNLESIYSEYDYFVFSSRFEGFGMVLLEAMSCGLPCVSFDCPTGPKEILGDGEYGILCKNNDINSLSCEMSNLMSDPKLRSYFSNKSLLRSANYHISVISKGWVDLFER